MYCCVEFPKKKRRVGVKIPWSDAEVAAVRSSLDKFFYSDKLPGKVDIEACIAKHSVLAKRTWKTVKDLIRNRRLKK